MPAAVRLEAAVLDVSSECSLRSLCKTLPVLYFTLPGIVYMKHIYTVPNLVCFGNKWLALSISVVLQAAEYHNFGYHTSALAVNLLDRFMAAQPTSDEELWTLQLAAVACLSIAAKMEEGIMPADIAELQAGSLLMLSC